MVNLHDWIDELSDVLDVETEVDEGGDRHQAEDLTADVFREALAGIGKFEWRGVPFAACARAARPATAPVV